MDAGGRETHGIICRGVLGTYGVFSPKDCAVTSRQDHARITQSLSSSDVSNENSVIHCTPIWRRKLAMHWQMLLQRVDILRVHPENTLYMYGVKGRLL